MLRGMGQEMECRGDRADLMAAGFAWGPASGANTDFLNNAILWI